MNIDFARQQMIDQQGGAPADVDQGLPGPGAGVLDHHAGATRQHDGQGQRGVGAVEELGRGQTQEQGHEQHDGPRADHEGQRGNTDEDGGRTRSDDPCVYEEARDSSAFRQHQPAGLEDEVMTLDPVDEAPMVILMAATSLSDCTNTPPAMGRFSDMYSPSSFWGVIGYPK